MTPRRLLLFAVVLLWGCPRTTIVNAPEAQSSAEIAAVLAASDLPRPLAEALPDDPTQATVHRLSNGMTVYISTDTSAPRVSAWIGVRVGSMHDPANSTGLAHYLEHMVFKGTDELGTLDFAAERVWLEKIPPLYRELETADGPDARTRILGEIDKATVEGSKYAIPGDFDRLYASLGIIDVNAYTTNDTTVYHCTVPVHRLESWAAVEAERFSNPTFRLFYPELESVYEEKNLALDDPSDIVWEKVLHGVFGSHPYGSQSTLGHAEHLRTPAFDDMVAQFERFYLPNNMAVAIVGDVTPANVLPMLERTFGKTLAPRGLPEPEPASVPRAKGRTFFSVKTPGEQGITLAWPTVSATHADAEGLRLLDALLVNGTSGLLEVEFELPQLVPAVYSSSVSFAHAGLFEIEAETRADQDPAQIEALLLDKIAKIKAGEFDDVDVEIAQLYLERTDLYALEYPNARAERLLDAFANHEDWATVVANTKRRRQLHKQDLVALAQRTFGPDFTAVHRHEGTAEHPRLAQPTPTPLTADPAQRSKFAQRIAARPSPPPNPKFLQENSDFEQTDTPTGPLIAAKNKRNSLFAITYRFDAGRRTSPLLCHAFDVLERSGTVDNTAAQRVRALAALGSTVRLSCGLDAAYISIDGLDRNFDASLRLVHAWIDGMIVDPEVLARVTANTLSERQDWAKDPDTIASALHEYALRGENSTWRLLPSNQQIANTTPVTALEPIRDLLTLRRTTEYYGPRSPASLEEATSWHPSSTAPPAPPTDVFAKVEGNRVFVVDQPTAKASAYLFFGGAPLPRDDRGAADIFEQYLNADMSSVVYQELRERRGLVYSSMAWLNEPDRAPDDVALFGYFASANDRLVRATEVLLDTLRQPPKEDAILRTQESRRRRLRLDRTLPRNAPAAVADWTIAGFEQDPHRQLWDRIGLLEPDDVAKFAAQRASGPYTLSVVGAVDEMGPLDGLGTVTLLSPETLFGFEPTAP